MEYYLTLKGDKLSDHEKTGRKLKSILISEKSQTEMATYSLIPTMLHSGKGETMNIVKITVVTRTYGGRRDK